MAIAVSAQALFDELPRDTRRALGDMPDVIDELEKQARVMRARVEELDATIQMAQTSPAGIRSRAQQDALVRELREARDTAERRLADIVTALETLRLDLLRLRAGRASAESITQNVEAARALGEDVDRLVAGDAEVERLLQRSRPEHATTPV